MEKGTPFSFFAAIPQPSTSVFPPQFFPHQFPVLPSSFGSSALDRSNLLGILSHGRKKFQRRYCESGSRRNHQYRNKRFNDNFFNNFRHNFASNRRPFTPMQSFSKKAKKPKFKRSAFSRTTTKPNAATNPCTPPALPINPISTNASAIPAPPRHDRGVGTYGDTPSVPVQAVQPQQTPTFSNGGSVTSPFEDLSLESSDFIQ